MNIFSTIWLSASFLFEPIQKLFNGNFWEVFEKKFGKFSGKTILDIACGTGELRRHIKPQRYIGIDINCSYIEYCTKNLGDKKTKFICVDANRFSSSEKFDITFFIGSLHHFPTASANKLFSSIRKYKTEQIVVVDGIPFGIFTGILKWLDAVLGGGKYFRSPENISTILLKHFTIIESGVLNAKGSFYYYPYWLLKPLKK